jgi:hypothetical protein
MTLTQSRLDPLDEAPTVLSWTWHPLGRNLFQGLLVLLLILCVAVLVLYRLGPSAVSAALVLVFVFSLRDYLLPSSCQLDPDGVSVSSPLTGTRRVGWQEVEACFQGAKQIKLSLRGGKRLNLPPATDGQTGEQALALITQALAGNHPDD